MRSQLQFVVHMTGRAQEIQGYGLNLYRTVVPGDSGCMSYIYHVCVCVCVCVCVI